MSSDPVLKSAVSHWGARFVANGVALTDFEDVTSSMTSYDDWCRAWSERAARHAGSRPGGGSTRSTSSPPANACSAPAVYYHFASFLFVNDVPQMKVTHEGDRLPQRGAAYLSPPGERVEIPFEGTKLAGILRKPAGVTKPPVMVMACGLDSTKEETEAYEAPFLARGIAILVFDGPGQGEAQYDLPIRGNYETAVKAVIDYIGTRADLDSNRVGMWGVSLGGYYAPRATAFDKRIKACIALGGPFNMGKAWDGLPELTREAFRVRSHGKTQEDGRQVALTLTLEGVAQNITCPIFIVNGRRDRIIPPADAERLAREVKGPVELMMIDDGNHIGNNRAYRWRSRDGGLDERAA